MSTIVYKFENNIYINLTNRCSHACVFCLRENGEGIGGHNLWLEREPTLDEVLIALENEDLNTAQEVVFCGYGEPTYRIDEIVKIADYLKRQSKTVRLDTNGCGNLINGFNIVPLLKNRIDRVSVSLNASSKEKYFEICRPMFGLESYDAMIDFAKQCADGGIKTQFSVVDSIGADEIEKCKQVAIKAGIPLRVREYIS